MKRLDTQSHLETDGQDWLWLNYAEAAERPANFSDSMVIPITCVKDIVCARQSGRKLTLQCGASSTEATLIATIISELARNIVLYAERGEIVLESAMRNTHYGITIISRDDGPGIPEVERALMGGYSTSGGLGLGLCGVRRMVDEFRVVTDSGNGTTITAQKWLPAVNDWEYRVEAAKPS
ncbi:MAG: ATP-binding protein, partial [Gammaproteobacteria bacterium]